MSTHGRAEPADVVPSPPTPEARPLTVRAAGQTVTARRRPRPVTILAVATGLLVITDFGIKLFERYVGRRPPGSNMINVGMESNGATWWNAVLLLTVVALALTALVLTTSAARVSRMSWLGIALAAAYLSLDEVASLHERLGRPMGQWATSRDIWLPTYAWIFPGAALAALGILVAIRWSRTLPSDQRRGLLIALGVYFSGALLMEGANGILRRRGYDLAHLVGTSVEETLEMAGCILAIATVARTLVVKRIDGSRVLGLRSDLHAATPGSDRA